MSLQRERETVETMVRLYCRAHHEGEPLCERCSELLAYANERLGKCPFGGDKPVCSQCRIQCYRPEMRERITDVMRYAGPRMAVRHPLSVLRHLVQQWRGRSRPDPGRKRSPGENPKPE